MTNLLIGIAIGLIVGWNLFPQPAPVKKLYDQIANFVKGIGGNKSDNG